MSIFYSNGNISIKENELIDYIVKQLGKSKFNND